MIEHRGELLQVVGESMAAAPRVELAGDGPAASANSEASVEGRVALEPCNELEPGGGGEETPGSQGRGEVLQGESLPGEGAVAEDAERLGEKKTKARPRSKRERMRTSLQEILDVEGAAEALGVSRRLVLRLLRAGQLPGKKVGREWRILRSAIVQWLKAPEAKEPTWLERAVEKGRVTVERKGGLG